MPSPDAAVANYRAQRRISASTLVLARRLWAKLGAGDFDEAWRTLGPQLLVVLSSGQRAAVAQATQYVPEVLAELDIDADPVAGVVTRSLVGVASDGRNLADLLYQPVIQTRTALGRGMSLPVALEQGRGSLDRIVTSQVADAGRAAESLETVVRPTVSGYVRMLSLPSCDRCAVLAGRHYAWNTGFQRHPRCDCRHIPATENVAGDLTTDPRAAIEAGQVHGLSEADTKAIADGADPGKVINAKRGMRTEQGQKVTKGGKPRPETIYKLAADRDDAIGLLKKFGYVR